MHVDLFCNILETTLVLFVREKLPDHRFAQDNDLKHTSRRAQAFFELIHLLVLRCFANTEVNSPTTQYHQKVN